jgi:hypothetical protein
MEKTLALLYGPNSEIDAICRDKLLEYIKGIDDKQMKAVKEFFLEAVENFKTKFPNEYETSNLKTLTSVP